VKVWWDLNDDFDKILLLYLTMKEYLQLDSKDFSLSKGMGKW